MTALDKVFMIEASVRLNFDNMLYIYRSGYTRIPVYEDDRRKVIGILFVKVSAGPGLWFADERAALQSAFPFFRGAFLLLLRMPCGSGPRDAWVVFCPLCGLLGIFFASA